MHTAPEPGPVAENAPLYSAPPPPADALNVRYLELLTEYDARAVRYKRQRLWVWGLGLSSTFLPLVLAVAGLAKWVEVAFGPDADDAVRKIIIPALQTLGTVLVGVQVFVSFRGRWLRYRAAAERLRDHCMRFRARARPYDGDTAEEVFGVFLKGLEAEMQRSDRAQGGWSVPRRVWAALFLDSGTRARPASPPDQGLRPRAGDPGRTVAEDILLVMDRLDEQRRWHLQKAGYFYRRYVGWQLLLALTYLASMAYVWTNGHSFAVVALVAAVGLILSAIRDFMGYGPLSLQYAQLADALDRVEAEHRRRLEKAGDNDRPAVLAALAVAVEDRLASEFRAWYLVHEKSPTD